MSTDDDLESLFDQIASERAKPATPAPVAEVSACVNATQASEACEHAEGSEGWYLRVGKIARNLHDALHELGYDKTMHKMAVALPDTRDRLSYISELTRNAAERALVAVETAKPLQEEMSHTSTQLHQKWDQVLRGKLAEEEFRPLVLSTQQFLKGVPQSTAQTEEHLMDILMAQDFHDLTGQVIKKIVEVAQTLESELVDLLVTQTPAERLASEELNMNGPVINGAGRNDIVTSQGQVDELLERLGF